MPLFLYVTTAFLVAAFLFLCDHYGVEAQDAFTVTKNVIAGADKAKLPEFRAVRWQAQTWLRADQPAASQARVLGVWVQLLSAFGISVVMLAHGWLVRPASSAK